MFNHNTRWAKGLVNLNQTPAQRRAKYRQVLELGGSRADAQQMRDWRESKILRAFGQK